MNWKIYARKIYHLYVKEALKHMHKREKNTHVCQNYFWEFPRPKTQLLNIPWKVIRKFTIESLDKLSRFTKILRYDASSPIIFITFVDSWLRPLWRASDSFLVAASLLCLTYPDTLLDFLWPVWVAISSEVKLCSLSSEITVTLTEWFV